MEQESEGSRPSEYPMNVGDKVRITHSPYLSVQNGTTGSIIKVRFRQYGVKWVIYMLDTKPCSTFKEYEIAPLSKAKENS